MDGNLLRRNKKSDDEYAKEKGSTIHTRPIPQMAETAKGIIFWVAVGATQIVGGACVALTIYWCTLYGGFSWVGDPNLQFYWHPVLMVLGLVYFYGNSIIIYRTLSFLPKFTLKIIHAGLHLGAVISSSVGLVAVLQYHWRTNKADFFSLHSWIGIATFGFFCLQYVGGFAAFLLPFFPDRLKAAILPFHVFFGLGMFAMAVGTAQMGFTEKLIWTSGYTDGQTTNQAVIGNVIGVLLIVFALLVFFISTHSAYKRKPLPIDTRHVN